MREGVSSGNRRATTYTIRHVESGRTFDVTRPDNTGLPALREGAELTVAVGYDEVTEVK